LIFSIKTEKIQARTGSATTNQNNITDKRLIRHGKEARKNKEAFQLRRKLTPRATSPLSVWLEAAISKSDY
jgi:hypothetical protein